MMLNHLRHAGALGKVENAAEIASDVIEEGGQVVLFTSFKDSAAALIGLLAAAGVEHITGDDSAAQRQAGIDQFQAGVSKAMVCTMGAGNVGITLTAASVVILVDQAWTPGDNMQAEDRLHRIGQKSAVTAFWLQFGKIDQYLEELNRDKFARIEMVLTGVQRELPAVRSARDVAREIFGGKASWRSAAALDGEEELA